MKKAFLGIDPGRNGGYALLGEDGILIDYSIFPYKLEEFDSKTFIDYLNKIKLEYNVSVIFEYVFGMPNQSSVATFNFGNNRGEVISLIKAVELPYREVQPTEWKKNVLKGLKWKAETVRFKAPKGISKEESEILKAEFKKLNNSNNSKAKREAKLVSAEFVFKTFPQANIYIGKNPHDGMSDAICMAYYGYLYDKGQLLAKE